MTPILIASGPRDLGAHVGGHQIFIGGGVAQQLFVQLQRRGDLAGGNAPNREANVVEDVIARLYGLVDDVEADLTPHAPEINCRNAAVDVDDLPRHSETHG